MPPVERTVSVGPCSPCREILPDMFTGKTGQSAATSFGPQPSHGRQAARTSVSELSGASRLRSPSRQIDRNQSPIRRAGSPFDHRFDHLFSLSCRLWAASTSIGRASTRWKKNPVALSWRRPPRPWRSPAATGLPCGRCPSKLSPHHVTAAFAIDDRAARQRGKRRSPSRRAVQDNRPTASGSSAARTGRLPRSCGAIRPGRGNRKSEMRRPTRPRRAFRVEATMAATLRRARRC